MLFEARTFRNAFTSETSVGFCHVDEGCKLAIDSLPSCNGIAKAPNNTFYVASALTGSLRTLELQEDNSLVVTDVIQNGMVRKHFRVLTSFSEYGLDNLSVDDNGIVWAAGNYPIESESCCSLVWHVAFPKLLLMRQHAKDGKTKSPTAVLKFSLNTGAGAFYGQKYNVEKVSCFPFCTFTLLSNNRRSLRMTEHWLLGRHQLCTMSNDPNCFYMVRVFRPPVQLQTLSRASVPLAYHL